MNAGDGVPWEGAVSPRGRAMTINLSFSLVKTEKQGHAQVWHQEKVDAGGPFTRLGPACRGRQGGCGSSFRHGLPGPLCSTSMVRGCKGPCGSSAPPNPSYQSTTFLKLSAPALFCLTFSVPCHLRFVSWLCPTPFKAHLPSL